MVFLWANTSENKQMKQINKRKTKTISKVRPTDPNATNFERGKHFCELIDHDIVTMVTAVLL